MFGEFYIADPRPGLKEMADEADHDSDAVSVTWCYPETEPPPAITTHLPDREILGAVVFIKGDAIVRSFVAWAIGHGYITPDKPVRDPTPGTN